VSLRLIGETEARSILGKGGVGVPSDVGSPTRGGRDEQELARHPRGRKEKARGSGGGEVGDKWGNSDSIAEVSGRA